jgi:hypothetical protein
LTTPTKLMCFSFTDWPHQTSFLSKTKTF